MKFTPMPRHWDGKNSRISRWVLTSFVLQGRYILMTLLVSAVIFNSLTHLNPSSGPKPNKKRQLTTRSINLALHNNKLMMERPVAMTIYQTFNAILFCVVHVPHVHEAQVFIESCLSCWINSDTSVKLSWMLKAFITRKKENIKQNMRGRKYCEGKRDFEFARYQPVSNFLSFCGFFICCLHHSITT